MLGESSGGDFRFPLFPSLYYFVRRHCSNPRQHKHSPGLHIPPSESNVSFWFCARISCASLHALPSVACYSTSRSPDLPSLQHCYRFLRPVSPTPCVQLYGFSAYQVWGQSALSWTLASIQTRLLLSRIDDEQHRLHLLTLARIPALTDRAFCVFPRSLAHDTPSSIYPFALGPFVVVRNPSCSVTLDIPTLI